MSQGLGLCLWFLLAGCAGKRLSQPLALYLEGARTHLKNHDPQGAMEIYGEILASEPAPEAWWGMSEAYLMLGDTQKASRAYFRGMELFYDKKMSDPYYLMRLGQWYGRNGDEETALEYFTRARDLNPNNAKAWNNIGVTYYKMNDYERARDAFQKSLSLDPGDQRVWHNLGLAYYHLGKYDEAISAHMASLHIVEARHQVWNDLGVSYKAKGELEKALKCYDRGLELLPGDPDLWHNKALLLDEMGSDEEAMYCYMKWAHLSLSWKAYVLAAKKAGDLGKIKLAEDLLDRALYLKPVSPLVWALRVWLAWKTQGLAAARDQMQRAGEYLSPGLMERARAQADLAVKDLAEKLSRGP